MRPPIWLKSIRFQLTCWYVATLSAIFLIGGMLLYAGVRAAIVRQADEQLATQAAQIHGMLLAEGSPPGDKGEDDESPSPASVLAQVGQAPQAPPALVSGITYSRLALRDTGATVAVSPSLARQTLLLGYLERLPPARTGDRRFFFAAPSEESAARCLSTVLTGTPYCLQIALPWDRTEDFLSRLVLAIALAIFLFLLFSGIGSWQLIRRTLSPINTIVTQAELQTADRLSPHLLGTDIRSDNEVGHLVRALDRMMARIYSAFDIQRRFTADASHELRTPLTILRGELELALARERSPKEYRRTLASGLEEVRRMSRIVESLAVLARYDAPENMAFARPVETFDFAELVADTIEQLRQPLSAKGLRLSEDLGGSPLWVAGDPNALLRVVYNLLDNAIKYTPAGGEIRVILTQTAGNVSLSVEDTGAGIAGEDLPHVFDRFYRADKSRANSGGSGLGLSIARSIAQAHTGKIMATSLLGAGSRFELVLPSAPPDNRPVVSD